MIRGAAALGFFLAAATVGGSLAHATDAEDQQQYQQADAQLNKNYHEEMGQLDPAGQAGLKSMQRAWVAFKEADFGVWAALSRAAGNDSALEYETHEEYTQSSALTSLGRPTGGGDATFGMKQVSTSQEADQILNSVYRQVISTLPPEMSGPEKSAQVSWIRFRDLYCHLDTALKGGVPEDAVLRDLTLKAGGAVERLPHARTEAEIQRPAGADDPGADLDETPDQRSRPIPSVLRNRSLSWRAPTSSSPACSGRVPDHGLAGSRRKGHQKFHDAQVNPGISQGRGIAGLLASLINLAWGIHPIAVAGGCDYRQGSEFQ